VSTQNVILLARPDEIIAAAGPVDHNGAILYPRVGNNMKVDMNGELSTKETLVLSGPVTPEGDVYS